ncbi:MAG TPA: phosphate signaling complex protein PhoU [Anaerolineales bacterium]|nr:phosphate signaling complex protein PhoU [Anaerolineales bacterium]
MSIEIFCQEIKNEVLLLSSMVEMAVMDSAGALKDNDIDRSQQVLLHDLNINRKRYEIEISIVVIMATQQPVARDLRMFAASLDICSELERMGDYAKEIANINIRSEGLSLPAILRDIYSMAEKAVDMLHRAMTTFAEEDMQTATAIIDEDDVIDACYTKLYYEAVNNVLGDPRNIERVNYVLWIAHNLERLGDRTTNVCERVIYIVTGERPDITPASGKFRLATS